MNRKKAIGLIGFGLSLFLVIHGMDVSAQQILPNDSLNTTANTTTNSAVGTTNNTAVSNAFDQLKDTFGSLFGK